MFIRNKVIVFGLVFGLGLGIGSIGKISAADKVLSEVKVGEKKGLIIEVKEGTATYRRYNLVYENSQTFVEMWATLNFPTVASLGKPNTFSCFVRCVGMDIGDDDSATDFQYVLTNVATGEKETIKLPVPGPGGIIGWEGKSCPVELKAEWTPQKKGQYELSLSYRYTDTTHPQTTTGLWCTNELLKEAPSQWGEADIIVVGNSMVEEGLEDNLLAGLTGYKVKMITDPGAVTAWQYLVLKNIIAVADNKPKIVVMVERGNVFTRPQYRNGIVNNVSCPDPKSAARYLAKVNKLRDPEEKELDEKAYPPDGEGDRPDIWNFKEALEKSLLPGMVRVAKESKIHLVIARHKTRWHTENPGQEPEEQKKYGKDLKAYLESNGCTFLDYSYSPELTIEHYADGDHLNTGNGRRIWTTLMAEDLKKVMAKLK